MVSNAQRLATAVYARRSELGMKTARALAAKAQLSERIIGDIENGRRDSYARSTLFAVDQALSWEVGSAQNILNGGAPVELDLRGDRATQGTPIEHALIDALGLDADRLSGLTDADLAEIEMVARLAASERARALQAEKREAIGERVVEAVRRSVDTRSTTTSPTRTTAQEAR